jgi:hypothetical protein
MAIKKSREAASPKNRMSTNKPSADFLNKKNKLIYIILIQKNKLIGYFFVQGFFSVIKNESVHTKA